MQAKKHFALIFEITCFSSDRSKLDTIQYCRLLYSQIDDMIQYKGGADTHKNGPGKWEKNSFSQKNGKKLNINVIKLKIKMNMNLDILLF